MVFKYGFLSESASFLHRLAYEVKGRQSIVRMKFLTWMSSYVLECYSLSAHAGEERHKSIIVSYCREKDFLFVIRFMLL